MLYKWKMSRFVRPLPLPLLLSLFLLDWTRAMDVITSSDPVDLSPLTPIQLLDDSFTADAELLPITYWLVSIDCWHMATVTAKNGMFQMT
jgi:hypothetical protein